MFEDPIVEEVRLYRREHAAKYGNDIHLIFAAFREMEQQAGHEFLNPGPKFLSDRKPLCVAEEPQDEYKTKAD